MIVTYTIQQLYNHNTLLALAMQYSRQLQYLFRGHMACPPILYPGVPCGQASDMVLGLNTSGRIANGLNDVYCNFKPLNSSPIIVPLSDLKSEGLGERRE